MMNKNALKEYLKSGKGAVNEELEQRLMNDQLTEDDEAFLQRISDMPGLEMNDGVLQFNPEYAKNKRGVYFMMMNPVHGWSLGLSYCDNLMRISLVFVHIEVIF